MAQIGVLGKGNCRASLRCPPHVTVPFPAVFYSYPTIGNRRNSLSEDSPSPYVGHIDLEKYAKKETNGSQRRRVANSSDHDSHGDNNDTSGDIHADIRKIREKKRRKLEAFKAPPGGSYRIPQKGQLQIIIKNPNKTAVKLFLVPYDLEGMEPGTKTFIRQRSYSAGPILDIPVIASKPEGPLHNADGPKEKPVLRYLIHLNICSPSRSRFYLYQGIRVVFANRVPDDKEKLRNEIQLPEPRYSPYKPAKDVAMGTAGAKLAQEKAFRRRSSGFGIGNAGFDAMDGIITSANLEQAPPIPPIPVTTMPYHMSPPSRRHTPPSARHHQMEIDSPLRYNVLPTQMTEAPITPPQRHSGLPNALSMISPGLSSSYLSSSSNGSEGYGKLSKGDAGYGGSAFGFMSTGEVGEGLLARRLKGLDVRRLEGEREKRVEEDDG
jgi:hypothetical protein